MPVAASSPRLALAARLSAHTVRLPSIVIGFDGFIDEMIRLVSERHSPDAYAAVPTIAAFGELVTKAAGRSSLREIVVTAVHPGGCAINMGDGLAALGIPVDCFATLGEPPHPAFDAITARFRSTRTWGREPGRTLAYEFADGKLMFSSVTQLAELTPAKVAQLLADGSYACACNSARLIALTDWTLYPHMTAVWQHLQSEVYSKLTHRPDFFVDLVDPSTRSSEDIRVMLATLPGFEASGRVTLGLNGNEAGFLARLFGLPPSTEDKASALALAQALRVRLALSEVVIHCIKFAAVAGPDGDATLVGPYCAEPKKSTGAGDRFNAGYVLGRLLDLPPLERLICGCATSGLFVRLARSPSLPEITDYLLSPDWTE